MDISIIIVSYNHPEVLSKNLQALYQHVSGLEYEVIVVDNASREGNVQMVKDGFPQVHLVVNASNEGFARGCNRGAGDASGRLLLFVNSDVILGENPVPAMMKILQEREDVGIVGCQLRNPDGSLQPSYYRFPGIAMRFIQLSGLKSILLKLFPSIRYKSDPLIQADFASGAFLLIKRDLFFQLGRFDERYFMYLEDADLCFQARHLGKKTVICNTPGVVHLGRHYESISAPFVLYHLNKGQMLFYRKNFRLWKYYIFLLMNIFIFSLRYLCLSFSLRARREEKEGVRSVIGLYIEGLYKYN